MLKGKKLSRELLREGMRTLLPTEDNARIAMVEVVERNPNAPFISWRLSWTTGPGLHRSAFASCVAGQTRSGS